ncbi:exo-alpha-sialidase [Marinoscillum sp. MHG1-6]|uniref:sialidase family protein n=1 Tax=Marinoscillum sp. MHG1-6 TaxID=2959627 RepID=UPI0021587C06|nr:sialidase family protein [Marinoscillum sp. MHG1-6]
MINLLKLSLAVLISAFIVTSCQPKKRTDWKSGILVDEFVYDTASFPQCHATTIEETTDGTLITAFFGGTKERNPDVCIWVCRKEADGWTDPQLVAEGFIEGDSTRYPTWNPVLYQVPNGELQLYYKIGAHPSNWIGFLRTSNDGGLTWSEQKALPEGFIGPVKNKPVLLENGTLISGSSTEGDGWKIHFELSKDFGKTWKMVGPINKGEPNGDHNVIQPSVLIHGDGKLQMLSRSRSRRLATAWSEDYGETWSEIELTSLPQNNSGTDAVTMADGRHALVYNHTLDPDGGPKGPRTPLHLSISEDGINWYAALILEDSPISQYSYPAIIQTSDGMLHVTYTWRRLKVKHVEIDPTQLELTKIDSLSWPSL